MHTIRFQQDGSNGVPIYDYFTITYLDGGQCSVVNGTNTYNKLMISDYAFSCSKLKDVYYGASQAELAQHMTIGRGNSYFQNATFHFA